MQLEETEQKLEQAEQQCEDLTKSIFATCQPCLEETRKAFYTSKCRRGFTLFSFKVWAQHILTVTMTVTSWCCLSESQVEELFRKPTSCCWFRDTQKTHRGGSASMTSMSGLAGWLILNRKQVAATLQVEKIKQKKKKRDNFENVFFFPRTHNKIHSRNYSCHIKLMNLYFYFSLLKCFCLKHTRPSISYTYSPCLSQVVEEIFYNQKMLYIYVDR